MQLTQNQHDFLGDVRKALATSSIVALAGSDGMGKTTLCQALCDEDGAAIVRLGDLTDAVCGADPGRIDEIAMAVIVEQLEAGRTLIIDDFEYMMAIRTHERRDLMSSTILPSIYAAADRVGSRLVLVGSGSIDKHWLRQKDIYRPHVVMMHVPGFTSEDYRSIASGSVEGARFDGVDFKVVHRASPMLNGYQIAAAAKLAAADGGEITTESFLGVIAAWITQSNVDAGKVEPIRFDSLPGSEHIAQTLEMFVVLPYEDLERAERLRLKAKRGVLLYGPPGSGKTSIGRALAHRMKGKFFMIDGSIVSEPPTKFFEAVQAIVAEAKANAPSVLFIDDADVLFGIEHIAGLSRYLLSVLDGVESESASKVCLMMTAMDPNRVPEPLLRSGRVELWLGTRLPDQETRERMYRRYLAEGFDDVASFDVHAIARNSEGFTPADVRRAVNDAKLEYASQLVAQMDATPSTHHVINAIERIRTMRQLMTEQGLAA
ncbi:AAA family ATPase [Peristeroidobacter soli]|uniref:AAA family ATPase n=1 Tax=Peristeroidobacter soli TaxID=2497877 RepID=UPI00158BD623|nr:ATP-binding protein [Peristeroidobacter soli]